MKTAISCETSSPDAGVEQRRVGRHEQVGLVPVDLGALRLVEGILDGQGVQAEFGPDDTELGLVGRAQVEPHDAVGVVLEVVRDLVDREVLLDQGAVTVEAGADPRRALGRGDVAAPRW